MRPGSPGPGRYAGPRRRARSGAVTSVREIVRGVPSCLKRGCVCVSCPPNGTHLGGGHCYTCRNQCHYGCGPIAALKRKLRVVK